MVLNSLNNVGLNHKGSKKRQSAAKVRENGDSSPTNRLATSIAATCLCLKQLAKTNGILGLYIISFP